MLGTPNLTKALAAVQAVLQPAKMDCEANIKSDKGSYKFKYASYGSVVEAIRPIHEHGLAFYHQPFFKNGPAGTYVGVRTTLLHESGESINAELVNPQPCGDVKAAGSAITYLKRYLIAALIGLATDADDDGSAANGDSAAIVQRPINGVQPSQLRPAAVRAEHELSTGPGSDMDPYAKAMAAIQNAMVDKDLEKYTLMCFERMAEGKFTADQVVKLCQQAAAKSRSVETAGWIAELCQKALVTTTINKTQCEQVERVVLQRIKSIEGTTLAKA